MIYFTTQINRNLQEVIGVRVFTTTMYNIPYPVFVARVKGISTCFPTALENRETKLDKSRKGDVLLMVNSLPNTGVTTLLSGAILLQGRVIATFKTDIVIPH